jgi:hypothetical protein
VTGRILQFKPRVETDITPLCIDILFQLAISVNVDPEVLVNSFREAHAGVKPPELTAAFALSHRVLCVFERLLLRAEYGDDVGDPEGAA